MSARTMGEKGLALLKSCEGLRLKAYLPTQNDVWTIGYGHTKGVRPDDVITAEQAHDYLCRDLSWAEEVVLMEVEVDLNQNQFDALVSLVFNIGGAAFRTSTLLKLLNQGKYAEAAKQFRRWDRQKGEVLPGLTKRRQMEMELFNA